MELILTLSKKSERKKLVEKAQFAWGLEQQKSFEYIKDAISNNTIEEADLII